LQGFYDRGKELNWKNMKDIQFVGAMGPPGGARNMLDPRFVSLFDAYEVQFPSNSNLQTIYTSILAHHVATLSEDIKGELVCRLCRHPRHCCWFLLFAGKAGLYFVFSMHLVDFVATYNQNCVCSEATRPECTLHVQIASLDVQSFA